MRWSATLLVLMLGCSDDAPRAVGSCDPLQAMPQPIQLGTVVAAGSGPDGTIYVVTRDGSDTRAFVSQGDTLVRRRVLGEGFGGELGEISDDSVSFEDAQPSRLVFQSEGDYAVRMALVHDAARTFYDDAAGKIELTVLPESALRDKPLRNLPGDIVLNYAAITGDGQQLIVTRPEDDATNADYRLYLGRSNALQQIPISSATVNAFARFEFSLHGMPGALIIGTQLSPNTKSVLQHDDGEWPLTLLPTGTGLPKGWTYSCL
jgi:hypothetical protein